MLQTPAVLLAATAAARPAATARRRSHPIRRTAPPAEWFTGAVGRPTPRPRPRPRPNARGSAAGRCVACAADGPLMWFCAVRRRSGARSVCRGVCWAFCSGNRANSIYNRIFARSRTPKRAKLVLGTSAVHVRSRLCSCFFGVGIQKNEKRAILCEKGAYCELVSSSSSLDI